MINLSVRTKILSLIAMFSLVIVGTSISSALTSKSVSSELQHLSSQSLQLMHNLEKSRQLLLQQSVEFERGYFQVSLAKSLNGYGIEQISESATRFKAYTDELLVAIDNVKNILNEMPESETLPLLFEHLEVLEERQGTFLKASTATYGWWAKLKTLQANKTRRAAAASLKEINDQMEVVIADVTNYTTSVMKNENEKLNQTILTNGIIAAILIAIGILTSVLIINGICKALNKAVRRAEDIASGELIKTTTTSTRQDEIGLLEVAMDKLVTRLSEILHDVSESSVMLSDAANNLNHITDESSEMVDRQQEETNFIANSIQEIQATAVHVSESTADASQAAHIAESAANEGVAKVKKTINSIEMLAANMESSAQTMTDLQTQTDEINDILSVIIGIAEQTNLLALNAAIEAARAGEQGRGFAVVADEVRQLAQNTQDATQKIEGMIHSLKTGTTSAVTAIKSSSKLSIDTVSQVRKEEESLNNINQSVTKIRDMNDRISATAEEQASVTTEIGQNISNITDIAKQTTGSIHSISQSANQLATLAKQLTAKISYFKV